ncbi:outer membrane protein assembly factor BamB family protein [Halapricum hydrolyticum]|uniref:PQQ-binding-like beta-propeller repeat protein n=1 Tax=Halapricum hydrolyticum TaxID=2979991 RepID=A0AAE3I974_9EURY|nr:PQQ-binding-like beta-propeller repeat protein [Halapricum hydrolyticum]MCU4717263.1 PQQ-binding-like beta-propeller repeat protein [Halapricum hydrolyticum]MCU4726190.1 PQQ-binding-like beta-propeller repeat protein [Halapricum hydrolyticum]
MTERASSTRRRYLQALGVVTAGVGLAGESARRAASATDGSWPQFGYDGTNAGHAPSSDVPEVNAASQWRFKDGDVSGSQPVVADGRLFVTVGDDVYGISLDDGEQLWQERAEYAVGSTPAVADGTVFVGVDNNLRAVSVDGSESQTYLSAGTDERIETSPVVADGIVYAGVRGNNGTLYALDATSGDEVWTSRTWAPIRSSPAVAGGVVYVGNDFGRVYAVDAADGTDLWKVNVSDDPIRSAVVVGDETIYVADAAGVLHAIRNEESHWSRDLGVPVDVSPAAADGTVYVPDSDGTLHALDPEDGSERWTASVDGTGTTPIVASGVVFVGTDAGTIYAFDATDGTELYTADAGSPVLSAPSAANGRLYVRTRDNVAAFSEYVSAAFEFEPASPKTLETITFDASASGPDSLVSSYEWSIDGEQATGPIVETTFDTRGTYEVALTVESEGGLTDTVTKSVPVANRPPTAVIEYTPSSPNPGETVTFSAAGSNDPDGEITRYNWIIGAEGKAGEVVDHTFDNPGEYSIQLTVRDDTGTEDVIRQTITVTESTPTPEPTPTPDPTPTPTPDPTPTPTPDPTPTQTPSPPGSGGNGSQNADSSASTDDGLIPIGAGVLATLTGVAGWLHFGRNPPEDILREGSSPAEPADQPVSESSEPADQPGSESSEPADQPGSESSKPADQPVSESSEPADQPVSDDTDE